MSSAAEICFEHMHMPGSTGGISAARHLDTRAIREAYLLSHSHREARRAEKESPDGSLVKYEEYDLSALHHAFLAFINEMDHRNVCMMLHQEVELWSNQRHDRDSTQTAETVVKRGDIEKELLVVEEEEEEEKAEEKPSQQGEGVADDWEEEEEEDELEEGFLTKTTEDELEEGGSYQDNSGRARSSVG
jgi:hypothetical protein